MENSLVKKPWSVFIISLGFCLIIISMVKPFKFVCPQVLIKNASIFEAFFIIIYRSIFHYIMPGMPPPMPPGIAGASSLISIKAHSVVKIIPATDAAFSRAIRVTFLGSIIPAFNIST